MIIYITENIINGNKYIGLDTNNDPKYFDTYGGCENKARYKIGYDHILNLKEPIGLDYTNFYEIKYKIDVIDELGNFSELYLPITNGLDYNYTIN